MKKPHDFRAWVWLINGVPLEGFAEGDDAVKAERLNDSIAHSMGADGRMSAWISADRSGQVTFKFAADSSSNSYLGVLMDFAEGGPDTFIPIRLTAKDQNLDDAFAGLVGYLKKPADIGRGAAKPSDTEWVVIVERLDLVFGGALNFPL